MGRPNVFEPEFDLERHGPVYTYRAARLGRAAGAERLGATLYELPPGEAPWPIHYHLNNEEMLVVLRGRPSIRAQDSERELDEGEVIARPVGEREPFQIVNRTEEPARILIVSEMRAPDVVRRPESGKLSVLGRPPGSGRGGLELAFFERDAVRFWEGEEPPPPRK
jgi:uncharacterized cupin superfamily protein